ncbi:MAG: hypothetical protein R2882_13375 [Gemmatimonadales bacterium]
MLEKLDRHRDAVTAYQRAAACAEEDPGRSTTPATASALGDFAAKAAAAFRSVIELAPDHVDAQWNLATALLAAGRLRGRLVAIPRVAVAEARTGTGEPVPLAALERCIRRGPPSPGLAGTGVKTNCCSPPASGSWSPRAPT